jgi:hypothetical protein
MAIPKTSVWTQRRNQRRGIINNRDWVYRGQCPNDFSIKVGGLGFLTSLHKHCTFFFYKEEIPRQTFRHKKLFIFRTLTTWGNIRTHGHVTIKHSLFELVTNLRRALSLVARSNLCSWCARDLSFLPIDPSFRAPNRSFLKAWCTKQAGGRPFWYWPTASALSKRRRERKEGQVSTCSRKWRWYILGLSTSCEWWNFDILHEK